MSEANIVTICSKGEIPFCVVENVPRMAPALGRQLDDYAVKEKNGVKAPHSVKISKTSFLEGSRGLP